MRKNRIHEIECLKSVTPAVQDFLWEQGSILRLSRNTTFIRAREPVQYVYFILSGKVIIYNLTGHGKRKIIFVYGKGALVNENVINPHYSSTFCATIEDCVLFAIPADQFIRLMEQDFSLTRVVLEEQERKIWRMGHQLKNTMGSIYLERKLAAKLWKLARDFGKPAEDGVEIDIKMTITFLADIMGAPRETTSRLCKTLSDYGLIKMERKKIVLPDPDKMAFFYREGRLLE